MFHFTGGRASFVLFQSATENSMRVLLLFPEQLDMMTLVFRTERMAP